MFGRYGRKIPMLIYSLSFIAFGVAVSFIPVFEAYIVLNIFVGAFCIASYVAVFTYSELKLNKGLLYTYT